MDHLGSESISYNETINLPDDILIILAKNYVTEKDGLSLSVSGASENFASFYGRNRKRLVISQCYFLALSPWNRFFQQHITASVLTLFDASHCYWLPAEALVSAIELMTNAEELKVQDTKISLVHLPQVFQGCRKIKKLSFTLAEENLDGYQDYVMEEEPLDLLKEGFGRLTSLKIFTFALNECYAESWLVTLGVLKWCRDCVDLLIQIATNNESIKGDRLFYDESNRILVIAQARLFPHLHWMRNLKSLVILRMDADSAQFFHPPDTFISELLLWLLEDQERPVHSLEHFWLNNHMQLVNHDETIMTGPSVKSLALSEEVYQVFDLSAQRFRHLEHVAGLAFRRLDHLPDLKSFQSLIPFDIEELNGFCQSHPRLEELNMFFYGDDEADPILMVDVNWTLLFLKFLIFYYDNFIPQALMDHMIKACPNIHELHLKSRSSVWRNRAEYIHLLSSIRFEHLIWLSITELKLFDGSYLPVIINQCPKLERIHLESDSIEISFFSHLVKCLPAASNLRDLRLKWKKDSGINAAHVVLLLKALLKCSSHFERLVLIHEVGQNQSSLLAIPVDFLVSFVSKMKHLVALCLVGFHFDKSKIDELEKRFTEEVVAHRPAFWFHVGLKGKMVPKGNDTSIPRIHYDEIVSPPEAIYTPPHF